MLFRSDGHAAELKEKIAAYREFLKEIADDESVNADIEHMFATAPGVNAEGKEISWEQTVFEEMPVCASITVLTKIQNDIRMVCCSSCLRGIRIFPKHLYICQGGTSGRDASGEESCDLYRNH